MSSSNSHVGSTFTLFAISKLVLDAFRRQSRCAFSGSDSSVKFFPIHRSTKFISALRTSSRGFAVAAESVSGIVKDATYGISVFPFKRCLKIAVIASDFQSDPPSIISIFSQFRPVFYYLHTLPPIWIGLCMIVGSSSVGSSSHPSQCSHISSWPRKFFSVKSLITLN